MIICISGPSGIGKTKLSIMLAKKYNAIIVNADATQIYKELNIGSAKITDEEKEGIKHYLFDIKSPNEDYSVCDYQSDARKIIDNNKDKNIIVIGGTGLYIKALFYDYKFNPQIKNEQYDSLTNNELYELAKKKDSNIDIHPNNRVRLINFLNNDNISHNADKKIYDFISIGLTTDRDTLYKKVDIRVDKMIEKGLLEEVKNLYEKYPNSNVLNRAIGYKELISYLKNKISFNEAIDLIKKNTRHYCKRQYTWFNNQMDVNWFDVDFNNFDNTYLEIIDFIESLNSK